MLPRAAVEQLPLPQRSLFGSCRLRYAATMRYPRRHRTAAEAGPNPDVQLRAAKAVLRRQIQDRLHEVSAREIQASSRAIAKGVLRHPAWQTAELVLAFVSLPREVATAALCRAAIEHGKTLGLPRVTRSGLVFHRIDRWPFRAVRSAYGIYEPAPDLPRLALTEARLPASDPPPLLIITPGLAFDRQGGRLGRGGAFYDRFFASLEGRPKWTSLAVCFALQLVARVPCGPTDRMVHAVVTEEEQITVQTAGE